MKMQHDWKKTNKQELQFSLEKDDIYESFFII